MPRLARLPEERTRASPCMSAMAMTIKTAIPTSPYTAPAELPTANRTSADCAAIASSSWRKASATFMPTNANIKPPSTWLSGAPNPSNHPQRQASRAKP